MKIKLSRILGVSLTIALLTSMIVVSTPASGANDAWSKMYPPRTGTSTRAWQLAPNSTPGSFVGGPIAVAVDGALYAYADTTTSSPSKLFKSTDDGHNWSQTGKQTTAIVDIATSPTEASVVFIATASAVLKSSDGGATFTTKTTMPTGQTINSIDVAKLGSDYVVLIGTSASSYGGKVYLYNEGGYPTARTDMVAGTVNALAVALSPNFTTDQAIFAVTLSANSTGPYDHSLTIKNKIGGASWGGTIDEPSVISANGTTTADIAFSGDFDVTTSGLANWYIATNGTVGQGIYLVNGILSPSSSFASALSTTAMHSLAINGNAASGAAQILGGKTAGGIIYSTNGGTSWKTIYKQPSGATNTKVLMASDYATSMKAWAATSGADGAVSKTAGSYLAWNQVGLINDAIGNITDLAFSGDTTYMATNNGTATNDSIWKHDGSTWERILSTVTVNRVQAVGDSVFVTNISGQTIYRSSDAGNIFAAQNTTNLPAAITGWLVVDANTIYTGAASAIYKTVNNGLTWTSVGSLQGTVKTIIKSPMIPGGLQLGTTTGFMYYTMDAGTTWEIAGVSSAVSATSGVWAYAEIIPAYSLTSPYNGYAISASGGVYQMEGASRQTWQQIDNVGTGSISVNTTATSGLVVTTGGTLYATASGPGQGVGRSLNPDDSVLSTATSNPYFETANVYTTTTLTASLSGLWTNGGNLYAIGDDEVIYVYTDTLATAVGGVSVRPGGSTGTVSWTALASATSYTVEVNSRSDWLGTDYSPSATSLTSKTATGLSGGRTYYARVRATAPLRTKWSSTVSFTTTLGTPVITADLSAPAPGAQDVNVNPVFTWPKISGASGYEFVIAEDSTFEIIDYAATTDVNYHGAREQLAYGTTYYWKVRAVSASSASSWVYGVFSTMAKPVAAGEVVETPEPVEIIKEVIVTVPGEVKVVEIPVQTIVEQPIPSYLLWTIIVIGGVLVIALIVLIVRTRRVA